ncbi:hypothetical protein, partial [Rhodovulum viride]|uniref:hypothetical protein n=1 Tax=Rhodovulum viride TaxID=1231134 RepID=UPI001C660B58
VRQPEKSNFRRSKVGEQGTHEQGRPARVYVIIRDGTVRRFDRYVFRTVYLDTNAVESDFGSLFPKIRHPADAQASFATVSAVGGPLQPQGVPQPQ